MFVILSGKYYTQYPRIQGSVGDSNKLEIAGVQ